MDAPEAAENEIASEQFAELASLGVTVRDREEFEDGVMKQLDREAAKRNIEQQKKFTEKELVDVRKEINMVGVELSNLDKTISALIKLPLAGIASKLRSTKSQKELKEKQLQKLRARELALSTKLQSGNFENEGDNEGSDDIAFGISVVPGNKEMADLIQHGHMTPFGGQIIDGVYHSGSTVTITKDVSSSSSANTDLTSNSVNVDNSSNIINLASNSMIPDLPCTLNSTTTLANSDLINYTENMDLTNSSHNTAINSKAVNDSVEVNCVADDPDTENSLSDKAHDKIHTDKGKGKAPVPHNDFSDSNDDDDDDDNTFIPYLDEDEDSFLSSEDSSHSTGARGSKVKRYRDIDSNESDDDMIHTNKVKQSFTKASSSRRRSQRCLPDDGDDHLYKLRMRELKRAEGDEDDENYKDMKFSGGLCIPGKIWHRLYKYQRTGVQWLWELHSQQAGGIVGDEMGLGKTIQMIAFLAGLSVSKLYSNVTRCRGLGPVLIVCPATVLQQWVREFFTWWPHLRVVILHNTGSFQGNKTAMINRMVKCNAVMITSYQGVRVHRDSLLRYKWDYVVLDEGHKIRNPDADITLTCKQFTTPHKIILSGSPMQNNLKELWSLFDFVFPGKLGTLPVFMEQFSVPITIGGYSTATKIQIQTAYRCACVLRDTISPYLLRRHKADVKIQLPSKNEQVLFCRLTDIQREMYEDYLKGPEVSDMLVGRTKVFAGISRLRKICNHPDLLGDKMDHQSGSDEDDASVMEYGHWNHSGKMVVVNSLLKVWYSLGHRVLLFSQTRKMLDVLERLVKSCGYTFRRMDGNTSIGSRQYLINCFNEDTSIFVFLLTTRVGGLGVNLTGADRVVIYDPDWNPSTDTQARERAWRIGQKKQVTIYRLLTTGTIEEKIYHRQIFKQFLTNRILRDPRQRRLFKTNDLYDLFTLGSSDTPSSETGALFAGTESEVSMKRQSQKNQSKKRSSCSSSLPVTNSPPPHTSTTSSKHSDTCSTSKSSSSSSSSKTAVKSIDEIRKAWQVQLFGNKETVTSEATQASSNEMPSSSGSCVDGISSEQPHHKQRKRRHDGTTVDGAAIMGLERTAVYDEQVEKENKKESDTVLKMLMKKSGLHSAFQHDAMVNGGDPDYVLIESEAEHVAQSAARALLQSRQQCQNRGWGLLTWTGQNGITGSPSMGAPRPRFGSAKQPAKTTHSEADATLFTGEELQSSSESNTAGSANLSSSLLLNKIQQRNAHMNGTNLPVSSGHVEQLREIRDFIACQCSKDGQATTEELISHFSGSSHASNQSTFRSMLNEICEFYREDGIGTWRLKPEYRY